MASPVLGKYGSLPSPPRAEESPGFGKEKPPAVERLETMSTYTVPKLNFADTEQQPFRNVNIKERLAQQIEPTLNYTLPESVCGKVSHFMGMFLHIMGAVIKDNYKGFFLGASALGAVIGFIGSVSAVIGFSAGVMLSNPATIAVLAIVSIVSSGAGILGGVVVGIFIFFPVVFCYALFYAIRYHASSEEERTVRGASECADEMMSMVKKADYENRVLTQAEHSHFVHLTEVLKAYHLRLVNLGVLKSSNYVLEEDREDEELVNAITNISADVMLATASDYHAHLNNREREDSSDRWRAGIDTGKQFLAFPSFKKHYWSALVAGAITAQERGEVPDNDSEA